MSEIKDLSNYKGFESFKDLFIRIINHVFKKNPKLLIAVILVSGYIIFLMLLSDMLIFNSIGFSTQSFFKILIYNYDFKDSLRSIILLLMLVIIVYIAGYLMYNVLKVQLIILTFNN